MRMIRTLTLMTNDTDRHDHTGDYHQVGTNDSPDDCQDWKGLIILTTVMRRIRTLTLMTNETDRNDHTGDYHESDRNNES